MLSKKEREHQHMINAVINRQLASLQFALDELNRADPSRHDYIIGMLEGSIKSTIDDLYEASLECLDQ